MKNIFKILFFAPLLFLAACGNSNEPCDGACPTGYECKNDLCVEIINPSTETVVLSGAITSDMTLTANKFYELAGKVIVEDAVLTIEPGTIIKGRPGTGTLASALIIARGAMINACGTAQKPIIFTSTLDNIKIGEKAGTNLNQTDNEKWGGVIVLGKAPVSTKDGDTEGQIEGIPADESYGKYGGTDVNDNSGKLCYVSIRHGGAVIGEGNEINGLSLGGVGAGTEINHIEIVANLDDGIEFFGGTVNVSNVIITYQDDDALDIDQNYSGTISNFYIIHGGDGTDEGLEIDGPENSTYNTGKFTIENGTVISQDGKGSIADLKSKAQGTISNVVFKGYTNFMKVSASFDASNACADKVDAYTHLISDDLIVTNCEIVSSDAVMADFIKVYAKKEPECLQAVDAEYQAAADAKIISAGGNSIVTSSSKGADLSELKGWSWTDTNGLLQ